MTSHTDRCTSAHHDRVIKQWKKVFFIEPLDARMSVKPRRTIKLYLKPDKKRKCKKTITCTVLFNMQTNILNPILKLNRCHDANFIVTVRTRGCYYDLIVADVDDDNVGILTTSGFLEMSMISQRFIVSHERNIAMTRQIEKRTNKFVTMNMNIKDNIAVSGAHHSNGRNDKSWPEIITVTS